jgi:hypothetical protein
MKTAADFLTLTAADAKGRSIEPENAPTSVHRTAP